MGHAALRLHYGPVSISLCGRECDDGGEGEGEAQRSFPDGRLGASVAQSRQARETPVIEDREVNISFLALLCVWRVRGICCKVSIWWHVLMKPQLQGIPLHVILRRCR